MIIYSLNVLARTRFLRVIVYNQVNPLLARTIIAPDYIIIYTHPACIFLIFVKVHVHNPCLSVLDWKHSGEKKPISSWKKPDRNAIRQKFQETPIPEKRFVQIQYNSGESFILRWPGIIPEKMQPVRLKIKRPELFRRFVPFFHFSINFARL